MERRRTIILLAAILMIGIAWLFLGHFGEPRYNGKRVSYWFRIYCSTHPFNTIKMEDNALEVRPAFSAMGTNALPYLLQVAFGPKTDSALRSAIVKLGEDHPNSRIVPHLASRKHMRSSAADLIEEMRLPPDSLLPLVKSYLADVKSSDYEQAIRLLRMTDTNRQEILVPIMIAALRFPNDYQKSLTLGWFEVCGPKASAAISPVVNLVNDRNESFLVRVSAGYALAKIGENSNSVLETLNSNLGDESNDWVLRCHFAGLLCGLDPNQKEAFTFLTNGLTYDLEPNKVGWSARLLGRLGSQAKPAIPLLVEVVGRTNGTVWLRVIKTLEELGVQQEAWLPAVSMKMQSKDEDIRFQAAKMILEKITTNGEAIEIMIGEVKSGSSRLGDAIDALAGAGTNAQAAIPALLPLLVREEETLWDVGEPLKQLGLPSNEYLSILKKKLGSRNEGQRLMAAMQILKESSSDADAKSCLLAIINRKSGNSDEAITALALAGATETLPQIREALKSDRPDIRLAAERAIKRLEAQSSKK